MLFRLLFMCFLNLTLEVLAGWKRGEIMEHEQHRIGQDVVISSQVGGYHHIHHFESNSLEVPIDRIQEITTRPYVFRF